MTKEVKVEEAIEELEILKEDYWDDDGYGHETIRNDNAMLALEMAIKALQEQIVWHPYPQEKPKDLNDKLVTIRESDGDRYTTIGFFDEGQWRGKNEFWIPNNIVTAWAELPKPYEGSEKVAR